MKKYFLHTFLSILFILFSTEAFPQTVAVFDFDCDDKDFEGNIAMMTDLLVHELVKQGDVIVVERKRLDKIMAEYAFQASPFVDITTAKKLGAGLGADCIIVGSVAALGCPLYITARMIDVEKGTILHSAKMKLNLWNEYEQKLPTFASECVRKMPVPNYFTGMWTGTVSVGDFEDYYEIKFSEKHKCSIKVTSINEYGEEIVHEGVGTYSYSKDEFSGGWMFKLQAVFKGAKIARLRKINWAYPINLNNEKNSFSLNFPLDAKKQEMVRLTLTKEE
ncbi:MAG: CsgG/HfaB family protein [Treponema sp.]